uniref:Uncharacterized protein n=2 Tax=Moniliophthora roreri TaxID=221103 RepID=A0A0W0GF53_MONRR
MQFRAGHLTNKGPLKSLGPLDSMLLYALARPLAQTLAATNSSVTDLFDPTTGKCVNIDGCRTVSDIVYSCLSVVLICTWVAIHPNVPEVGKHSAVVLYDDFQLMIVALLAPELVIMWAMRQWFSAKKITEKYKKYGWGMPHAFLVLMGGFALYDGEKFCGYLWEGRDENDELHEKYWNQITKHHRTVREALGRPEVDVKEEGEKDEGQVDDQPTSDQTHLLPNSESQLPANSEDHGPEPSESCLLEYLIANGCITITEDEINDNLSHGDIISKSIAVVQTTWFLLQVIARAVEGIAITELEIVTVAFALLNFGTYFLWWNKPLRIRHPVRVYWRQNEWKEKSESTDESTDGQTGRGAIFKGISTLTNYIIGSDDEVDSALTLFFLVMFIPLFVVIWFFVACWTVLVGDPDTENRRAGSGHKVLFSTRLKGAPMRLSVSVFIIAGLFGAIHCIPWEFQFPTHTEKLLWRVSALTITTGPSAMVIMLMFVGLSGTSNWLEMILIVIAVLPSVLYVIGRIILIVLALTALRDLAPSAYQTVEWTTFIPHIG